jgi:hypothetical protein
LFALSVHALGFAAIIVSEGLFDEDKTLLNCLEHVSCVEFFAALYCLPISFLSGTASNEGLDFYEICGGSTTFAHCRARGNQGSVAALRGRRMDFPINASISDLLEWFQTKVQSMPTAFAECNKNITCYMLIGAFKMLARVKCEHLPKLKKLALSCDALLLHDVPNDLGRIVKKLVKNCGPTMVCHIACRRLKRRTG